MINLKSPFIHIHYQFRFANQIFTLFKKDSKKNQNTEALFIKP